mgnify:FL=1
MSLMNYFKKKQLDLSLLTVISQSRVVQRILDLINLSYDMDKSD